MAQGFMVWRRSVPTMWGSLRAAILRAIRVRENLSLRICARMPRSDGGEDQKPGPKRLVRSSDAAAWSVASAGASDSVAVAKDSFMAWTPAALGQRARSG